MKTLAAILFSLHFSLIQVYSQEKIEINKDLYLTKLTPNTYIHTSEGNNGIIYAIEDEAIIVSTPASDKLTEDLVIWVKNNLHVEIERYIIDRWHPDAMGGLNFLQKSGIKTYANEMTRTIAKEKDLPVPDIGFDDSLTFELKGRKVICKYFGPAHTTDGIVVWLPDEKILFGGNEVRAMNGWVGNIADANLAEWSNTIKKVQAEFGMAEVVVPGHGGYGNADLLDYTISLYNPDKRMPVDGGKIKKESLLKTHENIFESSPKHTDNEIITLKETKVFFTKDNTLYTLETPVAEFDPQNQTLKADLGILTKSAISRKNVKELTKFKFQRLIVTKRNDEVKMVIIIRAFVE